MADRRCPARPGLPTAARHGLDLVRATWIDLVVREVAGSLGAPLAVRELVRRAVLRRSARIAFACGRCRSYGLFVLFVPRPLVAAETGTASCAILTSRTVSSMTPLSFPKALFLSISSRPSPANAAGKNLMMSRPSCSPA
eukprot:5294636-Pleurochrysis_carterae.AAC.4